MNPMREMIKPNVLYVDDELENLKSFKDLFRRDYNVFLAETAREALNILRTENICVLVTDQRMPEMSGTELLEKVASEFPNVLRYMLTGYSDYDPLVDAINRGRVHGYFSKPLNPYEFTGRVTNGLKSFMLKERNRQLLVELKEGQAKLEQAHHLAQIGVWDWDRESDRTFWSEEMYRIFGFDPGRAAPPFAEFSTLFVPQSRERLIQAREQALAMKTPYKLELEVVRPGNRAGWVYAVGGPTTNAQGDVIGQYGTFQDITEEKEVKEELRRARDAANAASEAKNEFLANMSHEIRTPLNGILGMLQLVQRTQLDEEQQEYVSRAILSSRRLTNLLTDILDLSMIEANKLGIRAEHFDLDGTMRQVAELFRPTSKESGVELRLYVDPTIPRELIGDPTRLQQVFTNFVGNSFKFTKTGHVAMEAYPLRVIRPGQYRVLFSISDTGIGIPDDKLDSLFHPFTQASVGLTRQFQGAGLGLSICKRLINLMGGEISIASEVGKGTSIHFCINFGLSGTSVSELQGGAADTIRTAPSRKVLLAEDDKVSAFAIRRQLEKAGDTVTVAEDGRQALEALVRENFDVVLMDVQMPVMDGVEATQAIRNGEAGKDKAGVPIIALTAYAMAGDKEKLLETGMDGYVAKPFELEELQEELARIKKQFGRKL